MKTRSAVLFYIFIALYSFSCGIMMLAIPWYFAMQNQSSTFNIRYAAITLISLFLGYVLGTFLDSYNRKKVLLRFFFPLAILLTLSPLMGMNVVTLSLFFALIFFGYLLFYPAIYSIIKDSFLPEKYLLHITVFEFVSSGMAFSSAMIGVLLLEGVDEQYFLFDREINFKMESYPIESIMFIGGTTLLASLFFLYFVAYKKRDNSTEKKPYSESFVEGFQWLFSQKKILLLLILTHIIFICMLVERFALLPMYIRNTLGETGEALSNSEVHYSMGSNSISALIIVMILFFSGFVGKIMKSDSMLYIISGNILIVGMLFLVSCFSQDIYTHLFIAFVFGFLNAFSRIFRNLYVFYKIPSDYMGRTMTLLNTITTLIRLGFVLLFSISYFNKETNVSYAYGILGLFALAGGLGMVSLINANKTLLGNR